MKTHKKINKKLTKEEEHEIEAATKYSGLVTVSMKRIRKECKIIKSFECQKIVRKIKAIKNDSGVDSIIAGNNSVEYDESVSSKNIAGTTIALRSTGTVIRRITNDKEKCEVPLLMSTDKNNVTFSSTKYNHNDKLRNNISKLQEKLRLTKEFDIDEAVLVCLKRLGLKQKLPQQNVNIKTNQEQIKRKKNSVKKNSEQNDGNSDGATGENDSSLFPPHHSFENKENSGEGNDTNNVEQCQVDNTKNHHQKQKEDFNASLIELILRHKRIVSVIKSINEKISEHNAWLSKREGWLRGLHKNNKRGGGYAGDSYHVDTLHRSKRTKLNSKTGNMNKRIDEVNVLEHDGNSGLFIDSLAGNMDSNVMGGDGIDISDNNLHQTGGKFEYGDSGYEDQQDNHTLRNIKKKKNRQGQRARKAKAMAIEARKAGHEWNSSVNWRKPKAKTNEQQGKIGKVDNKNDNKISASGLDTSKNVNVSDIAMMEGKHWKEDGNAHPSWAAREAQKLQSSVKFSGTKIVFD